MLKYEPTATPPETEIHDDAVPGGDPRPIVRRSRAKTIAMKRLTKEELRIGALLYPERSYWRPSARGECSNVARPCPYVSCKYHLYIDVNPATGSIKVNFPWKCTPPPCQTWLAPTAAEPPRPPYRMWQRGSFGFTVAMGRSVSPWLFFAIRAAR